MRSARATRPWSVPRPRRSGPEHHFMSFFAVFQLTRRAIGGTPSLLYIAKQSRCQRRGNTVAMWRTADPHTGVRSPLPTPFLFDHTVPKYRYRHLSVSSSTSPSRSMYMSSSFSFMSSSASHMFLAMASSSTLTMFMVANGFSDLIHW